MKQLDTWHPLLLVLVPILHLAGVNAGQVAPLQLVATGAVALFLTAFGLGACRVVMRQPAQAALLCVWLIVLFYAGGHAGEQLMSRLPRLNEATVYALQYTAAVLLAVSGAWAIRRLPRGAEVLVRLSAGASVAFFVMTATAAVRAAASTPVGEQAPVSAGVRHAAPAAAPDIYYIIVDGYARNDVLQAVYGFDNSAFLDELRARGFFVAGKSVANYAMTHLSLASTLNMRYLDAEFAPQPDGSPAVHRYGRFYGLIQQAEAVRRLQAHGYRYVLVPTAWGGTDRSPLADVEYRLHMRLSEFNTALLEKTLVRPLLPSMADMHRHALDSIGAIAAEPGPTFAFVHLLLPHNPYVFDRDGRERARVPMTIKFGTQRGAWRLKPEYVEQLIYLNSRLLAAIDAVLAAPGPRPLIILQSDHGSAATGGSGGRRIADGPYPEERLPILSAYLAPDPMRALLREDLSPVNTFRAVLAALFGEDLPLLPDRHFFSWYANPAVMTEVTVGDPASLLSSRVD